MKLTVLALKQHLSDAGYTSEITINLERRMGVPEVGESGLAEKLPVHLMGMVSVEKP